MPIELEIRSGQVEPIGQTIAVSGTDNAVSSTTVTTFELDGAVVEYSGGVLPFRAGDEATVAGSLGRDGIFYAYAVRLPRQGVTVGGSSPWWLLFGAVFVAIGCFTAFALGSVVVNDPSPEPIALIVLAVISIAFPLAGLAVMRQIGRARTARAMLDRQVMRTMGPQPARL